MYDVILIKSTDIVQENLATEKRERKNRQMNQTYVAHQIATQDDAIPLVL